MDNKNTISGQIQTQIDHTIQQIPQPQKITITKTYNDNYVDCTTDNNNTYTYIKAIGNNINTEAIGVLIPLENNEHIIIT